MSIWCVWKFAQIQLRNRRNTHLLYEIENAICRRNSPVADGIFSIIINIQFFCEIASDLLFSMLSDPPLRRQFSECHCLLLLIIQHDFDVFVCRRHQLHHQFPAGSAGSTSLTVWHDSQHLADLLFPVRQYIENSVALRTNSEGRAGIYKHSGINPAGRGKDGCSHAACLDIIWNLSAVLHRPSCIIKLSLEPVVLRHQVDMSCPFLVHERYINRASL